MKLLSIFIVVLLGGIFKLMTDMDFFKVLPNINTYADCKYLPLDIPGPEDITHYKNNILLTGSGNFAKVFALGSPDLEQMGIYAIFDSHKTPQTRKLEIIDFPKNVSLYIHGLYVEQSANGDLLFALNHAF